MEYVWRKCVFLNPRGLILKFVSVMNIFQHIRAIAVRSSQIMSQCQIVKSVKNTAYCIYSYNKKEAVTLPCRVIKSIFVLAAPFALIRLNVLTLTTEQVSGLNHI